MTHAPGVAYPQAASLFEKYPLSGRTYTTGSGTVIPDELQYYDGEMVHVYGECTNVAAVAAALAGSGYQPVILQGADGTRTAAAQLWISAFTQTSIGPYNALFIVVVAVPADAPPNQVAIRADRNGATSALPMLDGSFDAATRVYENRARLFLVRLLDTTQVAIDVGRERMGTDKRRGTIEVSRAGHRLHVAIRDERQRPVLTSDLDLPLDPAGYGAEIAQAAATAGMSVRQYPAGTEYAYPAVARIGHGAPVHWVWRSDTVPRLRAMPAGALTADPASEEGRMLLTWGFMPKVLGHMAKVRGLITGLAAPPVPILRLTAATTSACHAAMAADGPPATAAAPRQPKWGWSTTFLGSLTAWLRQEKVGETPDGLRINWHVIRGTFVGPNLDATVLPGAADWMRIRRDGAAMVNVHASFRTQDGALVYGSYGGIFDLGRDGYARALRDEYDVLPPVVVTPTYATADPRLEWLNRAQCIGTGRVDMTELRVEFDVYVVRVGERVGAATAVAPGAAAPSHDSLYARLGGHRVVTGVATDFVAAAVSDPGIGRFFRGKSPDPVLLDRVIELLCDITGGPCHYRGRDMATAHRGLGITADDWTIAIRLFTTSLQRHSIAPREQADFMRLIENMRDTVVEVPGVP